MNTELQRLEKELADEKREYKELAQMIEELEVKQADITLDDVLSEDQIKRQFHDSLDNEGDLSVCGIPYSPSYVLKQIDVTAYNTYFGDFRDSLEKDLRYTSEYKEKYDELQYEIDELQNDLEQMELTIDSLEEEIEELEEETDCLERREE